MSYASEVLADSPSMFLKLDDATTAFADTSGNGHVGTVTGTITASQPGISTELSASALFGGGRVDEDFGSATAYTDLTIEVWYKSTNGNGTLWTSRNTSGTIGFTLFIGATGAGFGSAGQISWGLDGPVYQGVNSIAAFHDGTWHHIVGVFSRASGTIASTDFKIYVDGSLQSVSQRSINGSANVPLTPSRNWTAGQHPAGWTNGTLTAANMAGAAIYPTALSPNRIYAHYAAAGLAQPNSVLSRGSAMVLTSETGANRSVSRESVQVLGNDQTINRSISRGSVAVINNDLVIKRTLSRMSVQVLVPSGSRYRGWGTPL